jgi:hypothetical protein
MSKNKLKDLTVFGTIEIDGVVNHVALPLPLLVQDGLLYLGFLVLRYFEEAENSRSSADFLFNSGQRILDMMSGNVDTSGCGIADLRFSLSPLVVREGSFDSWCRALLSVSMKIHEDDKLNFRISSDGLTVNSSLFWLGEYTSACDFRVDENLVSTKFVTLV